MSQSFAHRSEVTTILFVIFFLTILLPGCRNEEKIQPLQESDTTEDQRGTGCIYCHMDIVPDPQHNFECTLCHNGNRDTTVQNIAHNNLITHPAHPDVLSQTCDKCHPTQVATALNSLHFTLKNEINLVRKKFGATVTLNRLTEIPLTDSLNDPLDLADDMLRRRCLRCHVYSSGDAYAYTFRGQGCAACHMSFIDTRLASHTINKIPNDKQCLSCHYGNFTGADYYGGFEHDYNWEFRTPYTTKEPFIRPYGVEKHNLSPDIHQQRGLSCVDCHNGNELMGSKHISKISCNTCHDIQVTGEKEKPALKTVYLENQQIYLRSRVSGKTYLIPQLKHPAHKEYNGKVSCQVCHAQWSFNDSATFLFRSASDDFLPWEKLTVQSSYEIEQLLEHNLNSLEEEVEPNMRDGITGKKKSGLWHKGFAQRRWSEMIIRKDTDDIVKIFRPILALHLSAVDDEGAVLYDNTQGNEIIHLPYTPHTTGSAGLFYKYRFSNLNTDENLKKIDK